MPGVCLCHKEIDRFPSSSTAPKSEILGIEMMREGWFSPTINLTDIDPECGELDYITGTERRIDTEFVQSNNFAFGGINTSLIFKRM